MWERREGRRGRCVSGRMSTEHRGFVKTLEGTLRKSKAAAKKRATKLFTRMSVTPADDEQIETKNVEKLLYNGDFYTGQWAENVPHGQGKYLWTDGCMHVGEWLKGKTIGKGKFSWPSGAIYEGGFKSGYMDGIGTYTGSSGDTYKGTWVMNLKHGKGTESFANGDYYEGAWRRGMQDGQGRYQWKNGNHYIGQWKKGMIHGNGTMMWSNRNRYGGYWVENLPKGNGTFRWADESFYTGVWSQDPKEQSGTYYPSDSGKEKLDWNPHEVFTLVSNDCIICPVEKISIFPSQKVLCCSINEGESLQRYKKGNDSTKPRRMLVDGGASNGSTESFSSSSSERYSRDGVESLSFEGSYRGGFRSSPSPIRLPPVKKQGIKIYKGHKNYELMLNLQLGIRHSVGRPAPATSTDLKSSAFDPREKLWKKFPPEGSKYTPPHQSFVFKWKDYCPLVFRTLRKLFNVDPADYMLSICGNDALRELSSPGKSGSFFYLTNDDRYMIKTMKKAEVKVLLRMIPSYYNHVKSFENTLVTKFFGLHCVKLMGTAQKKVQFVIMGNLFCTEFAIHRRFDLKGSSHGRTTDKPETALDATITLKDLDLNYIFHLEKFWFQEFCRQVDKDCNFLEQERIMDYSLLVGLHFQDNLCRDSLTPHRSSGVQTPIGTDTEASPCLSKAYMDQLIMEPSRLTSYRLGIGIPAVAERTVRKGDCKAQRVGEPTGELHDVVMVFGIIDILQDYDISKKLEHAYKSFQYDPTSISGVDPKQYSKRFRDFIYRIFVEDT